MTKISTRDSAALIKTAMSQLEAAAEGKSYVRLQDIKDADLKALAKQAQTGSSDRVSLARLKKVMTTIGAEVRQVDHKRRGGDGDGELDFKEAQRLSPLAARLLDWAVDGEAMSGDGTVVMHVKQQHIDRAARDAMARLRTDLPAGRGAVKLQDAKGDALLTTLMRAAAERIADEAPTERRRVASGCGGSSYVDVRTVEPEDVLRQGVPRAKLRELITDAKASLSHGVAWGSAEHGEAGVDPQRSAVEDAAREADREHGVGTADAMLALFELMAAEAEKGNMRPTRADVDAWGKAPVSSGCGGGAAPPVSSGC